MSYVEQYQRFMRQKIMPIFRSDPFVRPNFPDFKPITYDDKPHIELITSQFTPYSDFNFTSAYTWNIDDDHAYSFDRQNLILKLADYVTGEPVYTAIGNDEIEATIHKLREYCEATHGATCIKLLPDDTATTLNTCNIALEEDHDNHDYIFSLPELARLEGRRYKNKRQAANKCAREYQVTFETLTSISTDHSTAVEELIQQWQQGKAQRGKTDTQSDMELRALRRAFINFNNEDRLLLSLAYANGQLVGFSIDELLHNEFVISHYFKTIPSIPGLSEHFNQYVADVLHSKGYSYWNWEQDLGIEELRRMKAGYRPIKTLKKYRLT